MEGLLGQHLSDNQQVFIMAFTPSVVPGDTARQKARAGLEQTWERVRRHRREQGITDQEFDDAVDEAMRHTRRES